MSRWKQWIKEPKGALPGGIVTKAGVVLIAVLVAGMLFSSSLTGPDEDPMAPAPAEPQAVDERAGRAFAGRLRAEAERHALQAAAEEARDGQEGRPAGQAVGEGAARTGSEGGAGGRAAEAAGAVVGMPQAEHELRETLRLEEIERRTRSLRALPVARSHRDPDRSRDDGSPPAEGGGGASGPEDYLDGTLDAALASFERSVSALEAEMHAGLTGEALLPGLAVQPMDPPGWERIREGSFLEAVLLTQLSGEFPGPVLAMVSVPLYSADRQRVLVPRGARAVGTALAVQDRDQSRLAVAFHRLLLPDGSWVDIEFQGLNQAGEGALKDRVNRRYLSTFAAAGAVGALSGLTLAGASAYGLRAGVGQGLGGSATSILDRYLNRMPEITIRAGHRLRIWFTGDVLVPTPTPHR